MSEPMTEARLAEIHAERGDWKWRASSLGILALSDLLTENTRLREREKVLHELVRNRHVYQTSSVAPMRYGYCSLCGARWDGVIERHITIQGQPCLATPMEPTE